MFAKFMSSLRGPDGHVREHVWDRICVPGHDEKDGESTDFNLETLSQMVDNFVSRGDMIPIDANHQSNYAKINGQPAPALGFYGAFAVVWDGKIAKAGSARDVDPSSMSMDGLDLSRDGLWGYRCEVTEYGDQLLPNFKLLSPTFTPEGVTRDGVPIGYQLAAVAATNSPWQSETQITFTKIMDSAGNAICPEDGTKMSKEVNGQDTQYRCPKCKAVFEKSEIKSFSTAASSGPSTSLGGSTMPKLAKLAKFVGMEENADDAAIKQALHAKMDQEAKSAMEEETYDYEGAAARMEDAAKSYEDAHMEEEGEDMPPHLVMRKMASKLRKMAKMAGDPPFGGKESPSEEAAEDKEKEKMAKLEDEKEKEKGDAKMATMEASLRATQDKLAKLEKIEAVREKTAQAERQKTFESLADAAIDGGYPKDKRDSLIKFASVDLEGARSAVAHLIKDHPTYLMGRMTSMGAPLGKSAEARELAGPAKPRKVVSMGHTFIEDDSSFADEIKKLAESKDPVMMAKVDKYLPESQRPILFQRLLAADKIVRAERPDLAAESAE